MYSPGVSAQTWLLPPPVIYPQREEANETWLDRVETVVTGLPFLLLPGLHRARLSRLVTPINDQAIAFEKLNDAALRGEPQHLRRRLREQGFRDHVVARAFALVREVARRTIGQRHFDMQLVGGFALLKGMIAEMDTGEGKTLTATLAAGTAALAGIPVHVITVND